MQHRTYSLDSGFKILGLSLGDLAAIVVTWFVSFQIIGGLLPSRMRIMFGLGVTVLVHVAWRQVKDRVPSGFGSHFAEWLGQRSHYDITPDTKPSPYIVRYQTVDEVRAQEQRAKRILRQTRRNRKRRKGTPAP